MSPKTRGKRKQGDGSTGPSANAVPVALSVPVAAKKPRRGEGEAGAAAAEMPAEAEAPAEADVPAEVGPADAEGEAGPEPAPAAAPVPAALAAAVETHPPFPRRPGGAPAVPWPPMSLTYIPGDVISSVKYLLLMSASATSYQFHWCVHVLTHPHHTSSQPSRTQPHTCARA